MEREKQCFVVMLKSLQSEAFKMELKLQKLAATCIFEFVAYSSLSTSFLRLRLRRTPENLQQTYQLFKGKISELFRDKPPKGKYYYGSKYPAGKR